MGSSVEMLRVCWHVGDLRYGLVVMLDAERIASSRLGRFLLLRLYVCPHTRVACARTPMWSAVGKESTPYCCETELVAKSG